MYHKRLEEIYEIHKKDNAFFEEIGIKKDNFRKLFSATSNPSLKTLMKIADVAKVKVSWILGESSDMEITEKINAANLNLSKLEKELKQKDELLDIRVSQIADKEKVIEAQTYSLKAIDILNEKTDTIVRSQTEQIELYKKTISEKEATIQELKTKIKLLQDDIVPTTEKHSHSKERLFPKNIPAPTVVSKDTK